jgi:hypothetical protein
MHQPPTDDELFALAREVFRNPPQSYYHWVDEMLAQRRFDARPLDNQVNQPEGRPPTPYSPSPNHPTRLEIRSAVARIAPANRPTSSSASITLP